MTLAIIGLILNAILLGSYIGWILVNWINHPLMKLVYEEIGRKAPRIVQPWAIVGMSLAVLGIIISIFSIISHSS